MLTPVALAARPRARAPEASSAVAVAAPAARPAVLVAPPPPRPPPPPSKVELRRLYPLLAWDREQPKGDIPMAQVPPGGVDLGWVHGKRVRATGAQLSGALERMKQNQVLGTARVMQHNDAVQQRWQAAAQKALQHGRRAPPEPRLLPLPPLKPVTVASWDYKVSSSFFNRKEGSTKLVLVPPAGADAGRVDLSQCTVRVASSAHSLGFFGSLAKDVEDGAHAVGKALDKAAPYLQLAATALSFVPGVNVIAAPIAAGLAAYQGYKAIKNHDVLGAIANIGGAVAGGLGGLASLAANAGATALEAGAKAGATVAGWVAKGATTVGDFARAVQSKSPAAWLAGAADLVGTAADGLAGTADGVAGKLQNVAGGLRRGSQVAGAIEQGVKAKDPGAVLQGIGGAIDLGGDLLGDLAPPQLKDIAGGVRTAGKAVGAGEQAVKAFQGGHVGDGLKGLGDAIDLGGDVLGGIAPPQLKDIANGVRTAGDIVKLGEPLLAGLFG